MGLKAHHYREQLYRLRAHPPLRNGFVDERDSFRRVYLSLFPFLGLEYFAELNYEFLPSGLVFPIGFLLYWAFYYTYYSPGFLEDRLATLPKSKDLWAIPTILMGVLIWFMKVTIVEVGHLLLFKWIFGAKPKVAPSRPKAAPHRPHAHHHQHGHHAPHTHATPPPKPKAPSYPREIQEALGVLGLQHPHDWSDIHHRYRELAKKYHPDLNREITSVGNRFMRVDAAYRKLLTVRTRFFK